jgi:hypothetical protein
MIENLFKTEESKVGDVITEYIPKHSMLVLKEGFVNNIFEADLDIPGDNSYYVIADRTALNLQKKMVNTGLDTAPIYSFDIPAKSEGVPEYASLKDIPVVVTQKVNQYDQEIMLKSEIGAAPQKICLPVGTKWVDEYVDINAAYPNFESWVRQSEGITSPVQAVGTRVDKYVDLILSNNAPYRTK